MSEEDALLAGLREAAARWRVRLDPGPPLRTIVGRVGFGRLGDGTRVVVKVAAPESDEAHSAAVLRHFAGAASVRLLEADGTAVLLERIVPGTPLVELGDDEAATARICDVAASLHARGMPSPDLTGVPADGLATVARWGLAFERCRRAGASVIPPALLDRAAELYTELERSQGATCLLHGDLQHYNVLRDDRRGWLAIDPKGVIGEPAYELGAMLRNPTPQFASPRIARRRVALMEERLGYAAERVLAWGFAQAVLSAVWNGEDGESPAVGLAFAWALLDTL